ncbi:MAG: UDP-N-acetylmuramate dehydrogenase [Lactobacillales bacterium]|jgi:UDP-N-acetylmuramate dehydrogenase|nr:UDP-N-acetylmuramate dehydrogenase [Lactobacillales bacterium]
MEKTRLELIAKMPRIKFKFEEELKGYSFTKTGGVADVIAFPKTIIEVYEIVNYCRLENIEYTVLGNASNLIISDKGLRGITIILTDMNDVRIFDDRIVAAAGAELIHTCYQALSENLTGLEFASGIPGTVGGAVFMNAGAYNGQIADAVESVEVVLPDGELKTFNAEEAKFGYRDSIFQHIGAIILNVTFKLKKGDRREIETQMRELTDARIEKQPLEFPSCGSVFKRPEGYFAGKLIQDAGLQGYTVGGAKVSEKHAGFIVNIGGATAEDYKAVIKHVQETVLAKEGVALETEVKILGE